tara:strand:- start:27 stop:335 length:309 start_codon:yes stop_codon:yes gene_type:complete
VKYILYGGQEWLLSAWSYTYGKKMSQKFWVSPAGKMSAIVIIRHKRRQKWITQSPDGEILDLGVCKRRIDANKMSEKSISDFLSHCEVKIGDTSKGFQVFIR